MFRLDINGLRFIAVMMVVLFHFKFELFYGGFAGVDIFFVISGFLMQEICSREMACKGWVLNFYIKRFKRIYPALLFSVLLTFLLAIYSEAPEGVRDAFRQAVSALTFTSNIFYSLHSGGYFATTSELNWLLHTWSLSVEWQYYLIFPFVLMISTYFANRKDVYYALLIVISLLVCLLVGPSHKTANFYLLPTRAWELLLGAFISTLRCKNRYPRASELVAIFILIAFTVFIKDSNTWPGVMTLIPVVATAVIIHANVGNERTALRHYAIQKIGSASYSIYLFHWPVVAFMANNSIEFSPQNSIIGFAISITLGFLSFHYLENFFKRKTKALILSTITFTFLFLMLSMLDVSKYWIDNRAVELDKYKNYTKTDVNKHQFGMDIGNCFLTSDNDSPFDSKCTMTSKVKKNILLIGDSHAAQMAGSMRKAFNNYNVLQATASGCMPVVDSVGEQRCTKLLNYIYNDFLKKNKVDYIFISAFWSANKDVDFYKKLAKTLNNITGTKVFIVGQTKSFSMPFYKIAQKIPESDIDKLTQLQSRDVNEELKRFLSRTGVSYIDIYNENCNGKTCRYFNDNGVPMFFDDNHLTMEWADYFVSFIKKEVNL
ncbi:MULTISPECIES: acyltransferase family protein [Klebsiella]|uniref:acyltransferase family protein n=1 Tax=Klebsiella TaxID=570 RepID=UPI0012B7921F|nr:MULTISPECIES: acyltransferase family protein [Klebsiella]